jgi:hypothetical protein
MVLGSVLVLFVVLKGFAPTAPSGARFDQVSADCTTSAGGAWVATHHGGTSPAEVRAFAGAINRCIIDTLGVKPSYIPGDQPIAGYRS